MAPAQSVMQNVVQKIFAPTKHFAITMFDNILTGGTTLDQLCDRVEAILNICVQYNVKLQFKKSWIGHLYATFFGYEISETGYRIDKRRKSALAEIPMPGFAETKKENITLMKRFLGFCVYFIPFVENFAEYASSLHDMTHKDFNWDKTTWKIDYEKAFNTLKQKLEESISIVFPDYSLQWLLMTDASEVAVGWVLLQLRPMTNGTLRPEPIAVGGEKFSKDNKWPIVRKEAYGSVSTFSDMFL